MHRFVDNRKINHMRRGEIIPMWRPFRILYIVGLLERGYHFRWVSLRGAVASCSGPQVQGVSRHDQGEFDRHAASTKSRQIQKLLKDIGPNRVRHPMCLCHHNPEWVARCGRSFWFWPGEAKCVSRRGRRDRVNSGELLINSLLT
jgi:hypothetical protein